MKTVRLYGNPNNTSIRKAIEILSNKCNIVVVPLETKTPIVASEDGVFEGLVEIEYYAKGWLNK